MKEDKIPNIASEAESKPPGEGKLTMHSGLPHKQGSDKMPHEHFQDKMTKALCE